MSYSRRPTSPKRHSTTFEAEPYREDGIRLYARYDDQVHDTRRSDSTVFTPRKRQRVEIEEERYRTISSGPPMISQGWRVPNLPKDIPRQQRIYKEAELVKSERIIAKTAQKKPVVLPLDPVRREQLDPHQRYSAPARVIQEDFTRKDIVDFETYKKEVQRLKDLQERQQRHQEVTVFDERLEHLQSPPPLPPPVHLREDIHQQKFEHRETISHDPARPMHVVSTEFPVHEPQYAIPVIPVRSPSPPQRTRSHIEEEAMRKFGEKMDILRNSKKFQHLRDPSEHLYYPRPQRTIEQIETIEIETEEYRRVPKAKTPPPPPPPVDEPVDLPPPRSASPKPADVSSTTSVDEHKKHIRVEVTEEIVTERIQRMKNKTIEVESAEKEVQVSQVVPEVIETATETIFPTSIDSSTQFESLQTVDSTTQHEAPRVIDSSTGNDELVFSTEVITTERWTQMEKRTFTDVSVQETAPTTVVADSSTQVEIVVEPLPIIETVEVATDPEPIVEPIVEVIETVETGVNTDQRPIIEKGVSEESESQFDECVEVSHY